MPSILSSFSGQPTILERANKISEGRRRNELAEIAQPLKIQEAKAQSKDNEIKRLGQASGVFLSVFGGTEGKTKDQIQQDWSIGKQTLADAGFDMSKLPDQFSQQWFDTAKGLASQAGSSSKIQSTFRDDEGNQIAVFRDGSTKNLGKGAQRLQVKDGVVFDPNTGQTSLLGEAGGTRDDVLTEEQRQIELSAQQKAAEEKAKLSQKLEIQPKITTAVDTAKQEVIKKTSEAVQAAKIPDAMASYNTLINSDLSKIYGRGEGFFPDVLRSQEGIDLIAEKDKLVGMLELGARGELKGQGTITDSEALVVSRAATLLGNPNISPKRARLALDEAISTLQRSAGVEPQSSTDLVQISDEELMRALGL